MTVVMEASGSWLTVLAAAIMLIGLALVWRGLRGGGEGTIGLLRAQAGMLGRIEGFRLLVCGLALIGVGVAVISQAEWLFWLSLGIAFVEILESSALIAVWKRNAPRERPASALAQGEAGRP